MRCEAIGNIVEELDRRSGLTKDGKQWESRTYLLRTNEFRQKMFKFQVNAFDEEIEWLNVGSTYKVYFSVEAREYDGKWFNNVTAWKIEKMES